jgi:hypothetical protein
MPPNTDFATLRTQVLREVAEALTGRRCGPESLTVVRRLETERLCTDCRGYGQTVTDMPDGGGIVRRCRLCNGEGLRHVPEAEPKPAATPEEAVHAVWLVLLDEHIPAAYNEYGSCSLPGFRVDVGSDGKVRVDHRMPAADLSDPDRPTRGELAAERHQQVNAYAATLTAAGCTVERGGRNDQRPWLIATLPAKSEAPEETTS